MPAPAAVPISYLLKRYVFHESGILVSGIVGGLYSSTATISVLARKSRKASVQDAPEYVAAMLLAVSMMFLRFLILIGIFSRETLLAIYPYLLIMSVVTAAVAWYLHSKRKRVDDGTQTTEDEDSSNPLEFKVALIFAMLFVVLWRILGQIDQLRRRDASPTALHARVHTAKSA